MTRKTESFKAAKFQTDDYEKSTAALQHMEAELERLQEEKGAHQLAVQEQTAAHAGELQKL